MFKKVEELLKTGAISEEIANALDGEISRELRTLRDEAKEYRLKMSEFEQKTNLLNSELESYKKGGDTSNPKIKELENLVKNLMSENEATKLEKSKLAKETQINKIVNEFTGLSKAGKDFLSMKLDRELNESFDIEVFKESFKRDYTELFNPVGVSGSGVTNSNGAGGAVITKEQLSKMSNEDYAKISEDIFSGKVQIGE